MAPDPNAQVAVNVRIEGRNNTIFEGTIYTKGKNVTTTIAPIITNRADGTNGNEYPFPVPTCTAALADASSPNHKWGGSFNADYDDFFIQQVDNDKADPNTEFWQLSLNFKPASLGGAQMRIETGDSVLWALIKDPGPPNYGLAALKLKGPRHATINKPFTVSVIDGDTRQPVEGATVGTQQTDPKGQALIEFTVAGEQHLKANYQDKYVRSNVLIVTVSWKG